MRSKTLVVGAATVLLAVGSLAGGASAKDVDGCAPGYSEPGAVTFEETLRLPRIQAGLEAGVYTQEDLAGVLAVLDENGDGVICLKAPSQLRGNSGKSWGSYYLGADNKH